MENEIKSLLDELCIELGFCLPPEAIDKITSKRRFEADQFTREVILAEGMNPELEKQHFKSIKRKFTERYGNEYSQSDSSE